MPTRWRTPRSRQVPGAVRAVERFGAAIRLPDGGMNRKVLGALVFGDEAARRDLEAIVHPAVYGAIEAWFATLPAMACAVADIPLLYETGREGDFDAVVVTACAPDEQLRRLMARDGLSVRPRVSESRRSCPSPRRCAAPTTSFAPTAATWRPTKPSMRWW